MKQLSRSVVFVNTNPKHEWIAVLKDKNLLNQLDEMILMYFKSLIDRISTQTTNYTVNVFG